jgi:hypothetical protein
MNNAQLYLAWLRTYAPTVYSNAVRTATGNSRSTGGLTDNLLDSALSPATTHSFLGDDNLDEITVTAQQMSDPITYDGGVTLTQPSFDAGSVTAPGALSFESGSSGSSGSSSAPSSTFANILTAVTAIGAGVLNYSNQNKLIQLNTTRAQQGLPPVNAQGVVVSPYGTATTNASLLAFEKAISGNSGSMLLPILAILGIGAFFILKPRSSAAS